MLSILVDEQAAVIQGAWNSYYTTMNIVWKFMTMLPGGNFAKPSSVFRTRDYAFLVENIQKAEVMKATADYISRICKVYDDLRAGENGPPSQAFELNIRIALCVYPVYVFPNAVFETLGPIETGVQNAAREFKASLETIAEELAKGTRLADIPDMATFGPKIHAFATRFNQYKESGRPDIQGRMERAIIALTANRVRHQPGSDEYAAETENINRVRAKLTQFAGIEALQALDARMANAF